MTTQQQYELLHKALHEQQRRLYLGTEALKIGSGGISQVAALSGADWKTVQRGVNELKGERARTEGRIRPTGGRKKATEKDSTLQRDLEELLEPKGDPMSLVKWTRHAPFALGQGALASLGIASRRRLWPSCSTRGAIPVIRQQENDGRRFPRRPRSAVWHITSLCKQFEHKQAPAISVDCKKKELLGRLKNQGREWQPKGQETRVNVYDYRCARRWQSHSVRRLRSRASSGRSARRNRS